MHRAALQGQIEKRPLTNRCFHLALVCQLARFTPLSQLRRQYTRQAVFRAVKRFAVRGANKPAEELVRPKEHIPVNSLTNNNKVHQGDPINERKVHQHGGELPALLVHLYQAPI